MKYKSTRDDLVNPKLLSFEDALFSGYAPDGGLYLPETIPELSEQTLKEWRALNLSYPEIVEKIIRLFISPEEIADSELSSAVKKAYSTFDNPEVIPLKEVKGSDGVSTCLIAELFHGKTGSFKDLALSLVGQFLELFMEKRKSHVTVLVGTSGDTGSAAIKSVVGLDKVDIIVLYPKGKISRVQELQMRTVISQNVHMVEVEGNSDELDVPIAASFPGPNLTSINSINWARIMIQIAHYVYLYIRGQGEAGLVHIVVPTGAAGNLTSGLIAVQMGVPIILHAATNENPVIHSLISKGSFSMGDQAIETPASAMDIGYPYNVERLMYYISFGETHDLGGTLTSLMKDKGQQVIPDPIRGNLRRYIKGSASVSTQEIYGGIRKCWELNEYMICPHTATAYHYFNTHLQGQSKVYLLATASPYKFPESVIAAGIPETSWAGQKLLEPMTSAPWNSAQVFRKGQDWTQLLQEIIHSINQKHSK